MEITRLMRLGCVALLLGGAHAAFAADIAPVYKAPVAAPAPVYGWTGFYAGVNVGYGVMRNPTTFGEALYADAESAGMEPHGALGGVQGGYNWQFAPHWVTGIEADLQATGQLDTNCIARCIVPLPGGTANVIEQKLPWFGTVRGRLGWATGPLLVYATGGLAYGRVETTSTTTDLPNPTLPFTFAHDKSGWAAGAGIESAIAGNWTAKAEYLHVDLGSVTDAYSYFGLAFVNTHYLRDDVFRFGVNYRFGEPQAYAWAGMPVKAAPAPYSWQGFYIGINAGYGVARDPASYVVTGFQPEAETFNLDPAGVLGGAQIGANWQVAQWVLGLETDIQAASATSSPTCVVSCQPALPALVVLNQRLPWFGTARGRVGWADGEILYYATGGLAYGEVDTTLTETNVTFPPPLFNPTVVSTGLNMSSTRLGWTAGAGIEGRLAGNWTAKAEYLYVDLGSQSGVYTFNFGGPGQTTNNAFTTEIREHIFRLGLNYRLN